MSAAPLSHQAAHPAQREFEQPQDTDQRDVRSAPPREIKRQDPHSRRSPDDREGAHPESREGHLQDARDVRGGEVKDSRGGGENRKTAWVASSDAAEGATQEPKTSAPPPGQYMPSFFKRNIQEQILCFLCTKRLKRTTLCILNAKMLED